VIRFSISPPGKGALAFNGPTISVSPDGRKIVFAAAVEGSLALWLRDLDASTARMLPGTEGGNTSFWAPDSRRLAFNAGGKLKKIDVAGGPPITLADASNATGSWSSSDEILFADSTRAVSRIAARGGMPVPVTQIDQKAPLNGHLQSWFLPGGRDFLFTKFTSEAGKFGVYVGALDAPNDPQNSPLLAGVSNVVYAPPGYLLFVRERSLMAQPFDAGKRILSGEAVPLVEQVYENSVSGRQGFGYFAASQNGVLAYATSRDTGRIQLTWFDREGKNLGTVGPPGDLEAYTLAPDGNSVVVAQRDTQSGRFDLWRHDLVRGGQSRLTFAESNRYPVFSADGSRVFFTREDEGKATTLSVAANGSGQPESVDDTRRLLASDASRDGRYLISNTGTNDRKQLNDLWVQPLFGDKKSFPYLATEFNETGARISPDGGWLAYQSNESKRDEVYVISFPMRGGKWQISTGGGSDPMWSRDGRELYFYSAGREIMAVDIRAGEQFSAGIPRPLFKANLSTTNNRFNVGKDGRFLLPVLLEQAASTPIEVIVNWPELLKR
jgi:Tol biopolymer transport system component